MEMLFLSYVNETKYLLWNLPFFKMVPPKTNFWLKIAQQTSIHIIVLWLADDTPCAILSQKCIVGEGPGEALSGLRCLSYLIDSFLTGIKHLAKDQHWGYLHPASDVYVRSFPCPFSH